MLPPYNSTYRSSIITSAVFFPLARVHFFNVQLRKDPFISVQSSQPNMKLLSDAPPLCLLLTVIHPDLAVTMCLCSKGAWVYGTSVSLSNDDPGDDLSLHYFFLKTNDDHESCCALTASLPTIVDLCVHREWLICSSFAGSPQRTSWLLALNHFGKWKS